MNRSDHLTLTEFLEEFTNQHAIDTGAEELILDVTSEEAEEFGLFFIRGMCGLMRGLRMARRSHQPGISPEIDADGLMENAEGEGAGAGRLVN